MHFIFFAGIITLFLAQNWLDLDTRLSALFNVGVCILVAMIGYIISNQVVRATANPLYSIVQIFETRDMNEKWDHFFDWAKANNLLIYFKLASSKYISVPVEIWEKDFIVIFIFGSKWHRMHLVHSSNDYLESIVIRAEDWKRYQDALPRVVPATQSAAPVHNPDSNSAPNKTPQSNEEPQQNPNTKTSAQPVIDRNEEQLRQKLKGKNTGWCPRLEVICGYEGHDANEKYLMKAWEKSKTQPTWKLSHAEKRAKAALNTIAENFHRRHDFFRAKPATAQEKQNGHLETILRRNLEATETNNSRLEKLRLSKWNIMEQYLEKLDFMTDAELYDLNPKLQIEVDSNFSVKKMLS